MREITKKFIVKDWKELTEEEKNAEITKYQETLNDFWGDFCYDNFKYNIEELKSRLKYITFDEVYVDENSQGYWIESIHNFNINIDIDDNIIDDIEFGRCKLIGNIKYFRLNNEWVTLEDVTECDIVNELKIEFETFKFGINKIVYDYFDEIYNMDKNFINEFFEDLEFEFEVK